MPQKLPQNNLDEITNKVFNELLQRRVDAHSQEFVIGQQSMQHRSQLQKRFPEHEDFNNRSDGLDSENSFTITATCEPPVPKARTIVTANKNRKSSISSGVLVGTVNGNCAQLGTGANVNDSKRPLIAKWKAGVKLQSTATNLENNGRCQF